MLWLCDGLCVCVCVGFRYLTIKTQAHSLKKHLKHLCWFKLKKYSTIHHPLVDYVHIKHNQLASHAD